MVMQNINLSGKFRALVRHSITLETCLLQQKLIRYVVRNGAGWEEMSFITAPSSNVLRDLLHFSSTARLQNGCYSELVTRNTQQTGKYVRTFLPEACNLEFGLHLEASEFISFLL